jgi:hypothetical protein
MAPIKPLTDCVFNNGGNTAPEEEEAAAAAATDERGRRVTETLPECCDCEFGTRTEAKILRAAVLDARDMCRANMICGLEKQKIIMMSKIEN